MSHSPEEKRPYGIIERLFSKLKYSKTNDQTEVAAGEREAVDTAEMTTQYSEEMKQVEGSDDHKTLCKFTVFCDAMEKFVDCLNDEAKFNRYIYEYPQVLQSRLRKDAEELQSLLSTINETAANVKKLKNQRKYVKKDISNVKRTIKRLKDNQSRELESLILSLDKDLYNRWMKSRWKVDELEEFMFDVQEKLVALESLKQLIDRQLEKSKENSLSSEDSEDSPSNTDQLVPLASPVFSFESPIPPAPPCPMVTSNRIVPLTVNSLSRNNSRLSWVQRRVRAERRGNLAIVSTTNRDEYETGPLSIPFNRNNNTYGSVLDNPLLPLEFDLSRFSFDSSGTTSNSTSSNHDESNSSKII